MAFDSSQLVKMADGNGFSHYRYDTLDSHADVDTSDYFNNDDDSLNLAVGDIIEVVVWATAVRTGTISDVARHVVMSITDGDANLSNDMLGATVAIGD